MSSLRPDGLTTPHPSRLSPDDPYFEACIAAHTAAVEAEAEAYLDPRTGLVVMTAPNLARRPCCESRCRHCPWIRD